MSTTALQIISQAADLLVDSGYGRWSQAFHLTSLNAGQRHAALVKPDVYTKIATVAVVAGVNQTVPSDGHKFLEPLCNMADSGGTQPGDVVTMATRELLDRVQPGWRSASQASAVENCLYDPRNPRGFYVSPPGTGNGYMQILYAAIPPTIATVNDPITLSDLFSNALLDYVLYRAYARDGEDTANGQLALAHLQAFSAALGVDSQNVLALNPNIEAAPMDPSNATEAQ